MATRDKLHRPNWDNDGKAENTRQRTVVWLIYHQSECQEKVIFVNFPCASENASCQWSSVYCPVLNCLKLLYPHKFYPCWSVWHSSFITCSHLFVYILRYILRALVACLRYYWKRILIEVLFHIFYRNFGRAEENRSLYRGFRYIEVH